MYHKSWTLAPAVLAAAGFASLTSASYGADNDPTNNSAGGGNASSAAKPSADPAPAAHDDVVKHHAALGVLISKAEDGVHVIGIIPGGAAERAGLRIGDEIRYVDDERVRTTEGLTEEIRKLKPGTQVDLSIRRNGERQIVKATLGAATAATRGEASAGDSANRREQPSARGRGSYSYGPNNGQASDPQMSQQIRALQQQISRLQQQIGELRSNQNSRISADQQRSNASNRGWNGSETEDDDPALFQ